MVRTRLRWLRSDGPLSRPAVTLAALRVALVPLLYALDRLVDRPQALTGRFDEILAIGAVYAVTALIINRHRDQTPVFGWAPYVLIDVALLGLLTNQSGGVDSPTRFAFSVLPIAAAFLARPRQTALIAVLTLAVFVLAATAYPETAAGPKASDIAAQSLVLI